MIDCYMFVIFLLIFICKSNNKKQRQINDVEIVSDLTLDFELSA